MKSNVQYSALQVKTKGEIAEIIVTSSKGKFTPQIKKDGSAKIKIEITVKGSLDSQTGTVNLADPKNTKLLEKAAESVIEKEVKTTISKTSDMSADIFGFGQSIYQRYPKEWKKLKPKWNEKLKNLDIEIDVKVDVVGAGRITQPLNTVEE